MWYKTFIPKLHEIVRPSTYFEIGTRLGYSLSVCNSETKISVDPKYAPSDFEFNIENLNHFKTTSDEFFEKEDLTLLLDNKKLDLAYIDGMHLIEFVLRDFINIEKHSSRNSIIMVDDVFPPDPSYSVRKATGGQWTGVVWKIIPILQKYRKDLLLIPAKSEPTGCLIVSNCDKNSTVLKDNYSSIINEYINEEEDSHPNEDFIKNFLPPEKVLKLLEDIK